MVRDLFSSGLGRACWGTEGRKEAEAETETENVIELLNRHDMVWDLTLKATLLRGMIVGIAACG